LPLVINRRFFFDAATAWSLTNGVFIGLNVVERVEGEVERVRVESLDWVSWFRQKLTGIIHKSIIQDLPAGRQVTVQRLMV